MAAWLYNLCLPLQICNIGLHFSLLLDKSIFLYIEYNKIPSLLCDCQDSSWKLIYIINNNSALCIGQYVIVFNKLQVIFFIFWFGELQILRMPCLLLLLLQVFKYFKVLSNYELGWIDLVGPIEEKALEHNFEPDKQFHSCIWSLIWSGIHYTPCPSTPLITELLLFLVIKYLKKYHLVV